MESVSSSSFFTARRIRERELRAVADALLNLAVLPTRRLRTREETCQASLSMPV